MLCYSTASNQKLRKFLGRIKMFIGGTNPQHLRYLTISWILEGDHAKTLKKTLLFVDFSKAFDSIHRGKMEQIFQAYGLPKDTGLTLTMLYKNMKVKVNSVDGDTDFFNIAPDVLQGDKLAPYMFIICQDYVLQTLIDLVKENGFTLKKVRNRQYPAQTITDADYADDITLLANTPTQAESLLQSLEQAAGSIGLYVNTNKTLFMCFHQKRDIFTQNGGSLKVVKMFTYHGSNVSSTENDTNMSPAKTWTAIKRLLIIWKSNLSIKIKHNFFQALVIRVGWFFTFF